MDNIYRYEYKFKLFELTFYADNDFLLAIDVNKTANYKFKNPIIHESNKIIDECILQIKEYCDYNRKKFNLPLYKKFGDFEGKIYECLSNVRYSETITYKELAEKAGNIKASRAVGNAMAKNRYPIIIPCHRVINSNGKLGNYTPGKDLKRKILEFEIKNKI